MTTHEIPVGTFNNITDYLFDRCLRDEHRDDPYLQGGTVAYSFADVYARSCQVGHLLKACGVGEDDRVAFSIRDGIDFPAVFVGAMMIGAVSVPINTYLKPSDYEYYIRESGAKIVIIDSSISPVVGEIIASIPTVKHIFVVGADGEKSFDRAIAALPTILDSVHRDPDDMAFWLYSSGTTGSPKGVVHTHAHLYWATELFGIGTMGVESDDVILCPPKMFFAFGLGNQIYFALRAAARVIFDADPPRPETMFANLQEHRPTILVAVPTLYASTLRLMADIEPARVRRACSRLRLCISGGEMLPPALARAWRAATGVEILDGVGTTEMTHMFLLNRPGHSVPNSCGRLVEGYRARIVDEHWRDVAQGEVGSLFVSGPTAASQYWNKAEKTQATMRDGGVLTGDKFYQDVEGNFYYVGRNDDMLRVGGIWVSPVEIETALAEHDLVHECAVVGIADEHGMIKPKAFVVARDPARTCGKADEMREFLRTKLAHHKCPRWIEFVPELPRTATGKIQRFKLSEGASHAAPLKTSAQGE